MNLTDNEVLKFLRGSPILFYDICAIYPATLGEIVDEGYNNFQIYLSLLTSEKPVASKAQGEMAQLLSEITDFQYFLLMMHIDAQSNTLGKKAFRFFCHENATFSLEPAQILIGPIEEKHIIDESKFAEFQQILRRMYFLEQDGEEIIIKQDDTPAVRRLKEQMKANREKVRRAKAKQAEREKSDLKFSDLIGSLTINDCGVNIHNIWDITYYAFHDQLKRMGWRDQFKINNQAAMAGAKLKKDQLKHWMRSIASNDK